MKRLALLIPLFIISTAFSLQDFCTLDRDGTSFFADYVTSFSVSQDECHFNTGVPGCLALTGMDAFYTKDVSCTSSINPLAAGSCIYFGIGCSQAIESSCVGSGYQCKLANGATYYQFIIEYACPSLYGLSNSFVPICDRHGSACTSDTECASPLKCYNGYCNIQCSSDSNCANQFGDSTCSVLSIGTTLCKNAYSYGSVSGGYCMGIEGDCPTNPGPPDCDKYFPDAFSLLTDYVYVPTSVFGFGRSDRGCTLESCTTVLANCDTQNSDCFYGKLTTRYNMDFPARDKTISITEAGVTVDFDCAILGCTGANKFNVKKDVQTTDGIKKTDYCFKPSCPTTGVGWTAYYQDGNHYYSCASICPNDPEGCSRGSCIDNSSLPYTCKYGIRCDDGGWASGSVDIDRLTLITPSQECKYNRQCTSTNLLWGETQTQVNFRESDGTIVTRECHATECPSGTTYDASTQSCNCPETQYYDNEAKKCVYAKPEGTTCTEESCVCPDGQYFDVISMKCMTAEIEYNGDLLLPFLAPPPQETKIGLSSVYPGAGMPPECTSDEVLIISDGLFACVSKSSVSEYYCDARKGEALYLPGGELGELTHNPSEERTCVPYFDCGTNKYYDLNLLECMDTINLVSKCKKSEYYDKTKASCQPIDSLLDSAYVDCTGKGYAYDRDNSLCLTRIECLDKKAGECGIYDYCSSDYAGLRINDGGWIGEAKHCPNPGTVEGLGSIKICYYLPSGKECSNTDCNVRSEQMIGEGWRCDPVKGPVIELSTMTQSYSSYQLMPSILTFGIQDKSTVKELEFSDVPSCSCKAQEKALAAPFCTSSPAYLNITPPIKCDCVSDSRLLKNTWWNSDLTQYITNLKDKRCVRLGFTGDCYWKYNTPVVPIPSIHGSELKETEVWCNNVYSGRYCNFTANHLLQFTFNITSLIDLIVFAYDKDHQYPIRMTSFTRGGDIIHDDGLSEAVFKLNNDETINQEFNIESSIGALKLINLDYASLSLYCSGSSSVNVEVNDNAEGIIQCDTKPAWKTLNFNINDLTQGVNNVKLTSVEDTIIGVDINNDTPWTLDSVSCGITNASPLTNVLYEISNGSPFVNNDNIFVKNETALYDLTNNYVMDLPYVNAVIRDALYNQGQYYVLTDTGVFTNYQEVYSTLLTGDFNNIFILNNKIMLAGNNFIRELNRQVLDVKVSDLKVIHEGIFFKSDNGINYWDGNNLTLLPDSSEVSAFDYIDWNRDGVTDIVGYASREIHAWFRTPEGFIRRLINGNISPVVEFVALDMNVNGYPEIWYNNKTSGNTSPFIELTPDYSLRYSTVKFTGDAWIKINNTLLSLGNTSPNNMVLMQSSAPTASCNNNIGGTLMARINYGEEAPVTVPDVLFPNINVDALNIKVTDTLSFIDDSEFSKPLYCMKPYYFKMRFIQDEVIDTWNSRFSFIIRQGGAPMYCEGVTNTELSDYLTSLGNECNYCECPLNTKEAPDCESINNKVSNIPYNMTEKGVNVLIKCQAPNCHWGLPRYESFKVCVSAGEFEYENCYALDTVQSWIGETSGLNGKSSRDSVIIGNSFNLEGYLWDTLEFYDQVTGVYLEKNNVQYCLNNSGIPVTGNTSPELGPQPAPAPTIFYTDCLLPSTVSSYNLHIYAGNYFDKIIDSIEVTAACTADPQCNDDNACTNDLCSGGLCTHSNAGTGQYDNAGTHCVDGTQVACYNNNHCTDASECTTDTCSASYTCSHSNKPTGTACTGGTCDANGNCVLSCTGCGSAAPCKCQGLVYYSGGTCNCNTCNYGSGTTCSTSDSCKNPICTDTGCSTTNKANGETCTDDGYTCTTDTCSSGNCGHVNNCLDGKTCCGTVSGNVCVSQGNSANSCCVDIPGTGWSC